MLRREYFIYTRKSFTLYSITIQEQLEEKLTITWKVHAVTMHLFTFLAKHGYKLAIVCEQVGEAVHHAMVSVLQRHKVAEDNPKYGDQLITSVTKFSSWKLYNKGGAKKKNHG